ncbi:unnamed protein product [Sphagnum troendelagicum]|uniref:Uncharacterized protein n=1 Tax=Sphagnum troendelagicum TaxID=128251 RepID=A0ABP0TYS5_9BRYO
MKHPALLQLLCLVCIILLPLSSTLPFVTCTSSVVGAAADSQTGLGALDSSCSSPEEGYSITTKAVTAARGSSSAAAAIGELQELTAEAVMELSSGGFEGGSSSKSSSELQSPVEPFMMQPTTNKARQGRRFKSRRMLAPNGCTNKDISIMQSRDGSAGIPQYSVQIVNTCISECAPTNIHVYCGWFASSPPPNPNTFTRLAYDDCLVNGGRPLAQGSIVEFQYANSFMYALSFRSANFCR